MLACYTNRLSLFPGEQFTIHASSGLSACVLEIARVGVTRDLVHEQAVTVSDHPTPADADQNGCDWPAVAEIKVGREWRSGYYDIRLTDAAGAETHHFICVKAARSAPRARAVLVLTTNTLHAYNYWGGASAYAHVEDLMARRATLPEAMSRAIGRLSTQRPFPDLLLAPPQDMPRLVNLEKRAFGQKPWAGADPAWSRGHAQSPYDGSAGFLNKWEHHFVRWAESEGLALDYLTDHDVDADPTALDGQAVIILVGHSEYWSARQRRAVDTFIEAGGKLACFSGNTAFWKVRWEDEGQTLICHKWRGFENDPVAKTSPAEATHLWSHPAFGWPEAVTTGLSFLFGGYHRLGLCAARGAGGYTVYRDRHWALGGCDLYYGDVFGDAVPLVGYENDGCALRIDDDGLPAPDTRLGVPTVSRSSP